MPAIISGILGSFIQAAARSAKYVPKHQLRRWCSRLPFGFLSYLGYAFMAYGALVYGINSFWGSIFFVGIFWIASFIAMMFIMPLTLKAIRIASWANSDPKARPTWA